MKVRYSREAVHDLRRLREFIEIKNPRAAEKAASTILNGIAQLKEFPLLGTKVDRAPNPEVVRDLVMGNYLARYLVHEGEIYVLRVWHHREDRF